MAILLAVDPLPNAFRTAANVTGMLALAAWCGARARNTVEILEPPSITKLEAP
jgi:hypothetical protein